MGMAGLQEHDGLLDVISILRLHVEKVQDKCVYTPYIHINIYIYIFIYMCVCVYGALFGFRGKGGGHKSKSILSYPIPNDKDFKPP